MVLLGTVNLHFQVIPAEMLKPLLNNSELSFFLSTSGFCSILTTFVYGFSNYGG
jgi:hypothetical protein